MLPHASRDEPCNACSRACAWSTARDCSASSDSQGTAVSTCCSVVVAAPGLTTISGPSAVPLRSSGCQASVVDDAPAPDSRARCALVISGCAPEVSRVNAHAPPVASETDSGVQASVDDPAVAPDSRARWRSVIVAAAFGCGDAHAPSPASEKSSDAPASPAADSPVPAS